MTDLQQEISTKLNIYPKGSQNYIKCLSRGIEIPINGRPEEMVRQIFLYFLIKESGLFPNIINIAVEKNNHDIEIYKKQKNKNFNPHQSPLIIVEVKREDVDLENYYNQIKRYLKQSVSQFGILYNYYQIIAFTRKNNKFKISHFNNIQDIKPIILQSNNTIDDNLSCFEKAQKGDFDSFKYLVNKYGKYATNTVVFKLKHQRGEIKGYFFNVQGNTVSYDVCGKYSPKQESFDYQDFDKLISITY